MLSAFKNRHAGVATYTDFDKMLEEVKPDAVIVATPHYSHVGLAVKALEKNISVLVEKPISVTVKEAEKLVEVAKAHKDAVFAIMYNQRSNSIYARAKKIIESGKLGDLQRASFTVTIGTGRSITTIWAAGEQAGRERAEVRSSTSACISSTYCNGCSVCPKR